MENADVMFNYYALCTAILVPGLSVDSAINKFSPQRDHKKTEISVKELEAMQELRDQGMLFRQIGEIYGISDDVVYLRLKKHKQRVARDLDISERCAGELHHRSCVRR